MRGEGMGLSSCPPWMTISTRSARFAAAWMARILAAGSSGAQPGADGVAVPNSCSATFNSASVSPFARSRSGRAASSGVAPLQSVYRAGGFSRLVGFTPNEITGQDYGVLLGGYTYQLGEVFGQKALVGGTLEYGNIWQRRSDMDFGDGILNGSLFIGADPWVGPIMLGIGAREGGHMNLFLTVGETF